MKTIVVGMKDHTAVCSEWSITPPPAPGAGLEDILRVLFGQIGSLETPTVPDSGLPHHPAIKRERP
jgi:hypothetical protein